MRLRLKLTTILVATAALTGLAGADAKLEQAMASCDAGAGTPLSGVSGVPEIYFQDMVTNSKAPTTFKLDQSWFDALVTACSTAADAANSHARFRYQVVRLRVLDGIYDGKKPEKLKAAVEALAEFAGKGSPDADFMMAYAGLFARVDVGIEQRRNLGNLMLSAADAGHFEALWESAQDLGSPASRYFGPDGKDVVRAAVYLDILSKGAPAPPLPKAANWKDRRRYSAGLLRARLVSNDAAFDATEKKKAFELFKARSDAGDLEAKLSYATSLEKGRATDVQPKLAMQLYAELSQGGGGKWIAGTASVALAKMLLAGADGKPDPVKARAVLEDSVERKTFVFGETAELLVPMWVSGTQFAREPRKALQLLEADTYHATSNLLFADLLISTGYSSKKSSELQKSLLRHATQRKDGKAVMALARLAAANIHPFATNPEIIKALVPFAASDASARIMLARLALRNLTVSSFQVFLQPDAAMDEAAIRNAVEAGEKAANPAALTLKALMLRRGVFYPQDDRTASKLLITAAEAGDVEAMALLGDAYREGLGVRKDMVKCVAWWRAAADAGSLDARQALVRQFVFLKNISLREGIAGVIGLFGNGEGFQFGDSIIPSHAKLGGAFLNSRIMLSTADDVAIAVLDGFRHAPAALSDDKMLAIAKALPDEARVAIEAVLKREGFYSGEAEGFFDPPVREALRAYASAKGPLLKLHD